jgi:CHAT domain-containing protein
VRTREALPEKWATSQNNLATAYADRIRGERADNLEQAIHHYEQALKVRTREALPEQWATSQNNLAAAYADRIRGERADNLERAIHHYEQALKVRTREAFPAECRRTQRNLGRLQLDRNNWALAHAAYAEAIKAGALLLAEAYTEAGRRAEVGEVSHLFANDAYCLLRLKRPAEALARMEEGKTRLLNEALALAEVDLALLPDADQQATQAARRAIRELEAEMRLPPDTPARRSDRELAEALREARADLNRLIETIRAARPEFLPVGLDLPELLALIPEGGALVAPFFAAKGSAVFVLPHGRRAVTEDDVVRLAQLTDADLQAVLRGSADEPGLGGWLGAYVDHKANPQSWQDAIGTTGRALWDSLMGPVHERLSALGLAEAAPVLLMPQGGLGLLPLHAAWREVGGERRHFIDDWTVSYAPSGYALSVSRRRLEEERRHGRTLLAVIDPTGDLPFTPAEGEAVAALFEPGARDALPGDRATRERVVAMAHGRAYLHLSCHGFYHWLEPMRSGVVLAGGEPLTLAEVIAPGFDLGAARLVVLSACETGLTDIRQSPDEYLGLPAGFLQAGAPTVVSTLWPVEDLSTMLLMERFYRGHLQEGLPPAVALRRSQLWLRDATAGDLNLAERWAEVYRTTTGSEARRRAFAAMRYFMRHPEDRPFASSYYWAPFTLTGA